MASWAMGGVAVSFVASVTVTAVGGSVASAACSVAKDDLGASSSAA